MSKDIVQKRIDYLRDIKNNIWTATIVSIGGTIALLFNLDNKLKIILFIIGILVSFILLYAYFRKDDEIELQFAKLEKE